MDGSKEYIEHCRTAIYCNVLIRNECNRKKPSTVVLVSHELLFNKQVLLWISLCSAWKPLLNSSTVDAAILNDWFIVWIASFESWIGHCDWELSSWLPLHSQAKTCRNLDSLTVMQLFFVHFGDVCRFSHKGHPAEKGLKTPRQKKHDIWHLPKKRPQIMSWLSSYRADHPLQLPTETNGINVVASSWWWTLS